MELISIREAARRLDVSDTAVHKAIKAGRVTLGEPTASGRPRVAWPDIQSQWSANTDVSRRTHSGPKKEKPAPAKRPAQSQSALIAPQAPSNGPSYALSRAMREAYLAQLSKLEFEQKKGTLIDANAVKVEGYNLARGIITALYNIPDRCADEIAGMTDANEIHKLLLTEIDNAVDAIRKQYAG